MAGGEDWLMRPILRGLCDYSELNHTNLDLCDFAMMNDALDVEAENKLKSMELRENGNGQ